MKKLLLASLLTLPSFVFAATPAAASSTPDAATQLVNKVTNGQVSIVQSFPALANLQGFVVKPNSGDDSRSMVVFADKSGQYLVVGTVIDANGNNLSDQYTQQYVNSGVAKAAWAAVPNTTWFSEGSDKAPHKAYVVIDPNCIYCHLLYQELEPLIQNNTLQVRWIPVGFLKPSSLGKAASLVMAKDPINAMAQNENNFDSKDESGGINALSANVNDANITAAFQKAKANTDFFSKFNFGGTPTILYMDQSGKPNFYPGYAKGDQLTALVNSMSAQWQ